MTKSLPYTGANNSRIILALDGLSGKDARRIGGELALHVAGGKVNDLIDELGVQALNLIPFALKFYDPKINDIANTVKNRMMQYRMYAHMVTVHAGMSMDALKAAAAVATEYSFASLAVTVLTDIDNEECLSIFGSMPGAKVAKLTLRAKEAGIQGIVCSPNEAGRVRSLFPDALIVTPGVRSPGVSAHDQQRVSTPANAIKNGANLVVCGRQIIEKETMRLRIQEAKRINAEINEVLEPA